MADYDVLVLLTEALDGRLRIFELAEDLRWEQSRVSHHLARMQRRGLVAREECTTDRRGAFVALTDAGRDAIDEAAPGHVDLVRRLVFDGMSEEHVAMLESFAGQILSRLADPDERWRSSGAVLDRGVRAAVDPGSGPVSGDPERPAAC